MKKIFLDTNVFLRFFVPENEQIFQECSSLFASIKEGLLLPYTSDIVMLECYYVLTSFYKAKEVKVRDALLRIFAMRNMTIIEETHTKKALLLWQKTRVKYTDCLIATQVGDGMVLVTYDREFQKLPNLTIVQPSEVIDKASESKGM